MFTLKRRSFVFLVIVVVVLMATGFFLLSLKKEPDVMDVLDTTVEASKNENIQVEKSNRLHTTPKEPVNDEDIVDQNAIAAFSEPASQNSKKNNLLSSEKENLSRNESTGQERTAHSISLDDIPESPFKEDLVNLDEKALTFALTTLSSLGKQAVHNDILSLNVDSSGGVFYTCTFNSSEGSEGAALLEEDELEEIINKAGEPQGASVPISSPPVRHSKPGASNVLYLDFNGGVVSGTAWYPARHGIRAEMCRHGTVNRTAQTQMKQPSAIVNKPKSLRSGNLWQRTTLLLMWM